MTEKHNKMSMMKNVSRTKEYENNPPTHLK